MGMNYVFTATGLSSGATSSILFSWTTMAVFATAAVFAGLL
jgi:hypothetical protein